MARAFVYVLRAPDGEIRYVGMTQDPVARYQFHLLARGGSYNSAWIKSLRPKAPSMDLVAYCDSVEKACLFEARLIMAYQQAGVRLTNMTEGGECGGYGRSQEACKKISETQKARLAKLSDEENLARMPAWTPARRAKQSETLTKYWDDPTRCAAHKAARKEAVAASWTPERRAATAARNNSPEHRAANSAGVKASWERRRKERENGEKVH